MKKQYLSAPLPFVGQKRMFAKEYIKVLKQFPEDTIFVDLFGGSGLLSHIAKYQKPGATVIYNDFDNYRRRLAAIPQTNELLGNLRTITAELPKDTVIKGDKRDEVFAVIGEHERKYGYVDYITLSVSLMFSMKYKLSYAEMSKEPLYNKIRMTDYPDCRDYLDGLIIVSSDYREIFDRYRDESKAVFLVDPPYLSTDVGTYKMYWRLPDYLDVLTILDGHPFIYFTSNKSSIVELCKWMGDHQNIGDPFRGCKRVEFNAHVNFSSKYTDIMLYKSSA